MKPATNRIESRNLMRTNPDPALPLHHRGGVHPPSSTPASFTSLSRTSAPSAPLEFSGSYPLPFSSSAPPLHSDPASKSFLSKFSEQSVSTFPSTSFSPLTRSQSSKGEVPISHAQGSSVQPSDFPSKHIPGSEFAHSMDSSNVSSLMDPGVTRSSFHINSLVPDESNSGVRTISAIENSLQQIREFFHSGRNREHLGQQSFDRTDDQRKIYCSTTRKFIGLQRSTRSEGVFLEREKVDPRRNDIFLSDKDPFWNSSADPSGVNVSLFESFLQEREALHAAIHRDVFETFDAAQISPEKNLSRGGIHELRRAPQSSQGKRK